MPAIPQTYLDKAYAQAFAGTPYEVRATPQGRNSSDRDDRPACCGNASCIPICPIQAKYDATVHLARAEKQPARRSMRRPRSTFVEVGADRRVTAIRYKRPDGSEGMALRQGVRARGARDRDPEAAADFAHGGQARTAWPTAATRSAAT